MKPIAIVAIGMLHLVPVGDWAAATQQQAGATPAQAQGEALRVFLDCQRCDFDYLRREITFVNYVRDRRDAQVHVLVTTREGGAGTEWTFAFIGLAEFEDTAITLVFNSSSTDTDDEVRAGYARVLRIGLLNYLADSPIAERIDIAYEPAEEQEQELMAQPEDDPWNFWVFRVEFDTEFSGEQRESNKEISGEFSANRTTEAWKIRSSAEGRYEREEFEFSDGSTFTNTSRDYDVSAQVVKSMGDHWGASIQGSAESSTFDNQDLAISFAPGIEYNVFPYAESSRRRLTVSYEIGYTNVDYEEETLFEKTSEYLFDQELLLIYDLTQPWGESNVFVEVGNFLNHFEQYRTEFGGNLEFRIIRGLSLNVDGQFSVVRDQRFIPKEEATDEEVLLRRRQLATDYEYEISIGFSYTFGSIFNNIVNPRFEGRRGGAFF